MEGQVGNIMLKLDREGRTIASEMPIKGKQGKHYSNENQQHRIKVIGEYLKRTKGVIPTLFTDTLKNQSSYNRFVQVNARAVNGAFDINNDFQISLFKASSGKSSTLGLEMVTGSTSGINNRNVTITVDFRHDPSGNQKRLLAIVADVITGTVKIEETGLKANLAPVPFVIELEEHGRGVIWLCWYDEECKQASNSVLIFSS